MNTRYLISAFAGDDAFDYDEGFRGEHQFWFSIQDPSLGDHAGEHDGGTDPEDGRPYARPTIMNATYIGRGATSMGGKDNNALIFRDNAGGMYFNSIFTEFQGHMLSIEDLDPTRGAQDSKARLDAGDLAFQHNILGAFGAGTISADVLGGDAHTAALIADASNMNRIADPMLQGISWNRNLGLDPRPGTSSPAWDASMLMEAPRSSGFLTDVGYAGAFGTENWAADWSALAELGFFSKAPPPVPPEPVEPGVVTITDADMVGNVTFTSDNTYLLSGLVFVEDGETLTIEPGTVIKGRASGTSGEDTALIVARGGRIFADGTARNPIIFTAEADDVNDPDDILLSSPTASRGLWGGVIILGRASINTATGENNIEGIDASTEPRGIYGGGRNPDDDDNSGVFRYVSIRHGGTDIGANNEINGLTMGGVGRGTTIEHVEVFYNQDDGFEWFGGTVNTRYLISAFAGDDAFDYDEGFRGEHQFWFSIQDPSLGDHAGEHDGGTDPEDGRPYARPTIMNATYIGRGASSTGGKDNNALIFRDNAGGMYFNSIFTEFQGHMLSIEDPTRGAQDSKARLRSSTTPVARRTARRAWTRATWLSSTTSWAPSALGEYTGGPGRRCPHEGTAGQLRATPTGSRTRCCRASAGTGTGVSIRVPATPVPPGMGAGLWKNPGAAGSSRTSITRVLLVRKTGPRTGPRLRSWAISARRRHPCRRNPWSRKKKRPAPSSWRRTVRTPSA